MLMGIKQKNKTLFPSTCSVIDTLFESLSQKSVGIRIRNEKTDLSKDGIDTYLWNLSICLY